MLKIKRSLHRLILNMGILIPGKDGLYIETGPRSSRMSSTDLNNTSSAPRAPLTQNALLNVSNPGGGVGGGGGVGSHMMVVSTYVPTKMGRILKLQYPFGWILKVFGIQMGQNIWPSIHWKVYKLVLLLVGIQMGHTFDSTKKTAVSCWSVSL